MHLGAMPVRSLRHFWKFHCKRAELPVFVECDVRDIPNALRLLGPLRVHDLVHQYTSIETTNFATYSGSCALGAQSNQSLNGSTVFIRTRGRAFAATLTLRGVAGAALAVLATGFGVSSTALALSEIACTYSPLAAKV